MPQSINRRDLLKNAACGAAAFAASGVWIRTSPAQENVSADRLIVGVMGLSRGLSIANSFASLPGSLVKYVCDVDPKRAGVASDTIAKAQKQPAAALTDFRRMLEDPAVHAIAIAAPNHWHAPATILASAAGKHVYVEKPCSHNPREGELAIEASRKFNRVVQHGTQRRSYSKVAEAIEKIRSGEIGKVRFVRSWYNASRGPVPQAKAGAAPPPGLDWDLWQGPAPRKEFRSNYLHYHWHWFWHWGNGELSNNGVHSLDLCRWGMNVDYPIKVTSSGGRYHFQDDQETPDTHVVSFDFGDKLLTWEGRSCNPHGFENTGFGCAFYGEGQTLIIEGGNAYRIVDPKGKEITRVTDKASDAPHFQNFLDAIRNKTRPIADIEEAHKSTLLCHLGNIAQRTGQTLTCDPKTGKPQDADAMKFWSREYEKGWEPKV